MTHTYATLEVSQPVYKEIAKKLKAASYEHAFIKQADDITVIDMNGIGLIKSSARPPAPSHSGWIVGNSENDRWRAWDQGNAVWVDDPAKATRYARREDAEAVHAEDEDAWVVRVYDSGEEPEPEPISGDDAIAIGEHAFRAGFKAGAPSWDEKLDGPYEEAVQSAWNGYDPPEDIKARSALESPYKKYVEDIARFLGESDDPFAAWESLHRGVTVEDLRAVLNPDGSIKYTGTSASIKLDELASKLNARTTMAGNP